MADGAIIPVGRIEESILLIRGERVMLDGRTLWRQDEGS
jgi:hypothetical protein